MSRFFTFFAPALLALLAFGLVACDDDDGDDGLNGDSTPDGTAIGGSESPEPGDDGSPEPTDEGSSSAGGEDDQSGGGSEGSGPASEIVSLSSSGDSLEITTGTTVQFLNDTEDPAIIQIDGSDESEELAPGDSFEHTFDETGEFMIGNGNDPEFMATVIVS